MLSIQPDNIASKLRFTKPSLALQPVETGPSTQTVTVAVVVAALVAVGGVIAYRSMHKEP